MATGTSPSIDDLRSFAPVFIAGLAAYSVTAFFVSHAYSLFFSLWFAVAACLSRIVALDQESIPSPSVPPAQLRRV